MFRRILRGDQTPEVIAYCDSEAAVFPSKAQQPGNRGRMLVVPDRHVEVSKGLASPLMTTLAHVAAAVKAVTSADGVTFHQGEAGSCKG